MATIYGYDAELVLTIDGERIIVPDDVAFIYGGSQGLLLNHDRLLDFIAKLPERSKVEKLEARIAELEAQLEKPRCTCGVRTPLLGYHAYDCPIRKSGY